MKSRRSTSGAARFALSTLGVEVAGTLIAAEQLPEITIEGSTMTKEVVGRSTSTGAPIESVTLTRHVNYSDLDLSAHTGAHELENRVNETAKATCDELDKLFPFSGSQSFSCVKKAVEGAMVQAHNAINAAEKTRAASK